MIVTLTVNPSLDRTVELEHELGPRHPRRRRRTPGLGLDEDEAKVGEVGVHRGKCLGPAHHPVAQHVEHARELRSVDRRG